MNVLNGKSCVKVKVGKMSVHRACTMDYGEGQGRDKVEEEKLRAGNEDNAQIN